MINVGEIVSLVGMLLANGLALMTMWSRISCRLTALETENKDHAEMKSQLSKLDRSVHAVQMDVALIKQKLCSDGGME